MAFALTVLAVLAVLLLSEWWWRRQGINGEFSRKFVHIVIGSFVAAWPFFLGWGQIQFLSLAFLVVVIASKQLGIFTAIHSIQRPTWGEVFFAAAVGLTTLITNDEWVYAAALLQMSLADGLAATVGVHFGKSNSYRILGHVKSVAGTAMFFVVSVAILVAYSHWSGTSLEPLQILLISVAATIVENLARKGLDNLLVPLAVALLLVNV